MHHRPVYGLDIETQANPGSDDPPDPHTSLVRTAVLSTARGETSFTGDEASLLEDLDDALFHLEPGIIATWNGGTFTMPFLADRASMWGLHLGLRLAADPRLRPRGELLRGHATAYRAGWHDHGHLDAARLFRSGRRPLIEVDEMLRSLGFRSGSKHRAVTGTIPVVSNEVQHDAAHTYPSNDARLVRVLVERRLPGAARAVDRIVLPGVAGSHPRPAVLARFTSSAGATRPPLSPAHPAVRAMLAAQG